MLLKIVCGIIYILVIFLFLFVLFIISNNTSPEEDIYSKKILKISNGIIKINKYAFENWGGTIIELPDTIKKIDDGAFLGCGSLHYIKLPNGLTEIGRHCFASAISLESISIPKTVNHIGASAFVKCKSLKHITIPENLIEIEGYVFADCISLEHIEIPNNIKKIHSYAFENCKNLNYVLIKKGIIEIDANAFIPCPQLKYIDYEGTIEEWKQIKISSYAFDDEVVIKCTDGFVKLNHQAWGKK
jgi:hypothetical protein